MRATSTVPASFLRANDGPSLISLWYAYNAAWQQLRERSEWIELGISTPQLDAQSYGDNLDRLMGYASEEPGVLAVAGQQDALALTVFDGDDWDPRLLVVDGQR
jgi:hypothetical protein